MKKEIYEKILLTADVDKNVDKLVIYTTDGNYYTAEGSKRLCQVGVHNTFLEITAKQNSQKEESTWFIPYQNITAVNYKTID